MGDWRGPVSSVLLNTNGLTCLRTQFIETTLSLKLVTYHFDRFSTLLYINSLTKNIKGDIFKSDQYIYI